MTPEDIIGGLKESERAHDRALSFLYQSSSYASPIKQKLQAHKLSEEDIQTIWTDTVVRFASLVREGKYQHQGNILGYLFNLSRFIMLNYLKAKRREVTSELASYDLSIDSETEYGIYNMELRDIISRELYKLGNNCKDILTLWSQSYSMREIKEKLKVVSEEAMRKRKHICLKKLLVIINKNENLKKVLKSYVNNS